MELRIDRPLDAEDVQAVGSAAAYVAARRRIERQVRAAAKARRWADVARLGDEMRALMTQAIGE